MVPYIVRALLRVGRLLFVVIPLGRGCPKPDKRRTMKGNSGFTLLELLVTISVAGILLAIAIPNFRTFIQNDTLSTQANNVVFALNFGRSEAVKRDANIYVCPSSGALTSGQATCDITNWAQGWMVYWLNGTTVTSLQNWPTLVPAGLTLTSASGGNPVTLITYRPDGTIVPAGGANAAPAPIAFKLCDSRLGAKAVSIELTATGRPQASPTPGKTLNGTSLTCP